MSGSFYHIHQRIFQHLRKLLSSLLCAAQDTLVWLPVKADFVESDLSTEEYNLTGLLNYPVLATAGWLAVPASADEAGTRAAAAAILWRYTSADGEAALTEDAALVTSWNTASDETTLTAMQVSQVGNGILPEPSPQPDLDAQAALAAAGAALAADAEGAPRTSFTQADRETWRDAVTEALATPAEETGEE